MVQLFEVSLTVMTGQLGRSVGRAVGHLTDPTVGSLGLQGDFF